MGNDLKCASTFSTGENNMFYLVPRVAAVNCVCSCFCRIANFKLAESLTPQKKKKKIDWAVVKIQRAPARSSFAPIDLRENSPKPK